MSDTTDDMEYGYALMECVKCKEHPEECECEEETDVNLISFF